MVRFITKRDFVEKLLIDIKERPSDNQIRSVKEVLQDCFGITITSDDDNVLQKSFITYAGKKQKEYENILVEYRVNDKKPFGRIHELPELIQKFKYGKLLDVEAKAIEPAIIDDRKIVLGVLDSKDFADQFRDKFVARFEELKKKLISALDEDTVITLS